jgi:hypothetical protein
MSSRIKVLLLGLPCLLFTLSLTASAQNGRLFGNVAYVDSRAQPARGVRVIAVGSYLRSETRTDSYGNFAMVLPGGRYRILGQGAYPYSQRTEVTGYVRPYTDSYISPNPLVLEYGRSRSSNEGPILSAYSPDEANVQDDSGFVNGRVVYWNQGQMAPAVGAYILAFGDNERSAARANRDGIFQLHLKAGTWRIGVQFKGYRQRVMPIIKVERSKYTTIRIEMEAVPDINRGRNNSSEIGNE